MFARQTSRGYIPQLDGLRSVSLLIVMIWHASLRAARYYGASGDSSTPSLYDSFPHGEVGVLMFFIISGFVVSLPFVQKGRGRIAIGQFYLRRFVRIYPPYLLALIIAFLALGVLKYVPQNANSFQSDISLSGSFLASLFYVHGVIYNAPSRLNPPMWSLELEIIFYAVLPIFMTVYQTIPSRLSRCLTLAALIMVNIVLSNLLPPSTDTGFRFRQGFWHYGYYFLAGILLAETADWLSRASKHGAIYDGLFAITSIGLFGAGLVLTSYDAVVPSGLGWIAFKIAVLCGLMLIFVCAFRGRLASGVLSRPSFGTIGVFCYSIYLVHVPVMQACSEVLSKILHVSNGLLIWPIWIVVLVPASVLCGGIFYLAVERPCALAASRLGRPRRILPSEIACAINR